MSTKAQRQAAIAELLGTEAITSQDQIVDHLSTVEIAATQATVSRDLEDLGAIKVRIPGGASAYAIPDHPHEQVVPVGHLRRVFAEWVVGADASALAPPGIRTLIAPRSSRSRDTVA